METEELTLQKQTAVIAQSGEKYTKVVRAQELQCKVVSVIQEVPIARGTNTRDNRGKP